MIQLKTINTRLENSIFKEPKTILNALKLTKQPLYKTANRQIPDSKMEAFARLEASRKNFSEEIDFNNEREKAMNKKYGF